MFRVVRPSWRSALSSLAFILPLAAGTGNAVAGTVVVLATDTSTAALVSDLAAAFAEAMPSGTYQVKFGPGALEQTIRLISEGQERGRITVGLADPEKSFDSLLAGRAALVLTATPLPVGPAQRLAPESVRVIGFDGLAVIVNRSNPIADPKRSSPFSLARLARILAGEVADWSDLGGERGAIRLHLPSEQSSLSKPFEDQIMRPQRRRAAAAATRHLSGAEIAAAVGRDRNALGIVSIGDAGPGVPLPLGLSCGLIYQPSAFSLQTQAYPLTNRVLAYTFGQPSDPLVDEFVQYIAGTGASEAIRNAGFIDAITRVEDRQDTESWLSAALPRQETPSMRGAASVLRKLSQNHLRTTARVHFKAGSAEFGQGSTEEMELLARLLGSDEMRNRSWLLLGFADDASDWRSNVELGARRAAAVSTELQKSGLTIDRNLLVSFGSLGNSGCASEPVGSQLNRRVELWVKVEQ